MASGAAAQWRVSVWLVICCQNVLREDSMPLRKISALLWA